MVHNKVILTLGLGILLGVTPALYMFQQNPKSLITDNLSQDKIISNIVHKQNEIKNYVQKPINTNTQGQQNSGGSSLAMEDGLHEVTNTGANSGQNTKDITSKKSSETPTFTQQKSIPQESRKEQQPVQQVPHTIRNSDRRYTTAHAQWKPPALPQKLQTVNQQHPDLVDQIRDNWILAPGIAPLNLSWPHLTYFSQDGQDKYIDKLLRNKTGGFYIECGAYNGEGYSNTLFFERERGWKGLLIEANPLNFDTIIYKHRNSYMLNACLSPTSKAATMNFTHIPKHPYLSRLEYRYEERIEAMHERYGEFTVERQIIQCFPTFSILAALGRHIDFFSLDIETAEVDILSTIPFDKVDIDVFLIETCTHCTRVDEIQAIMEPHGYKLQYIPDHKSDIVMSKI